MDEQRTDRTGWRRLVRRPRIGRRLMLLLMALACVLSTYIRASLDLRRENARSELNTLKFQKWKYENELWYRPQNKSKIADVSSEIDERLGILGETSAQKK